MSSSHMKNKSGTLQRTSTTSSNLDRSVAPSDTSPPSSPERKDGLFPTNLTSRMSVNTVCDVVEHFDEFKKWLVNETGFGGTLHLNRQKKVNLKFSAWIMSKVDTEKRFIDLGGSTKLCFWDSDVHKALGAPCGPRNVREAGKQLNQDAIKFIRNSIGMDSPDSGHSLKAAEAYLLKDINPNSSKLEQQCFKIAYVIFVMGNFFSPGTKHDYSSIDFWYALGDADIIEEFDWCEYILEELMKAVTKLKNDILIGSSNSHLAGCHLFFQIFYLDNLDLGGLNKKHVNMPRIGDFTYETIKRMINMSASVGSPIVSYTAAVLRPSGLVAYTRAKYEEPKPTERRYLNNYPELTPRTKGMTTTTNPDLPFSPDTAQNANTSSSTILGALDFSRHLQRVHPNFPRDGVALAMKEYMARQVLNATNLRNTQITDMVSFADKLIAKMAAKCMCCTARGFDSCIMAANNPVQPYTKVQGRILDLDEEEDVESRKKDPKLRKSTPASSPTEECPNKPNYLPYKEAQVPGQGAPAGAPHNEPKPRCPLAVMASTATGIVAAIQFIYDDLGCTPDHVIFGDRVSHNHEKIDTDVDIRWGNNWFTTTDKYFKLSATGYTHIMSFISRLGIDEVSRTWISHRAPRYINIPGIVIRKQLIGNHPLDHELGSIIVRRMNQIAFEDAAKRNLHPWTMSLEPDFAIAAIADMDCSALSHIRNQFVSEGANTIYCWLWHVPLFLMDGWCNIAFEMTRKNIHIMDPTAGPRGQLSLTRKKKLEMAADKILTALFQCLRTFYTNWPVDEHNWSKKFPSLMDSKYSRDQSGICTTFFMIHFGGKDMKLCVSKDNISRHRRMLAHQVMLLEGNDCSTPHDHLVAASTDAPDPSV